MLRNILIFSFLLAAQWLVAQDSLRCQDVVYMKGGSIFRGTITAYDPADMLRIKTWSGVEMVIPGNAVQRVVQECQGAKSERKAREYNFDERGWYHNSRVSFLFGEYENGYSLQHSSGYKFSHLLGVGLGIGLENYAPGSYFPITAPVFAEARGYLSHRRITPFYALGIGASFIAKEPEVFDWWGSENTQSWKGGMLLQGQLGYRIGNHFQVYLGIRFQRLTRDWNNSAWGGGFGTDKHLKKRIEFGVGLLL